MGTNGRIVCGRLARLAPTSALLVLCSIGLVGPPANSVHADVGAAPPTAGATADASRAHTTVTEAITFNFDGATFRQVVDFFAREAGLPVVWESDPPEGTLSYRSPEAYPLDEALHVLNVILQSRGVMLRVSDDMLHLQKLTEMQRESIPTFIGALPEELRDDELVTVVVPLRLSAAAPLAEKLATMVAAYGAVTPLVAQNALVITETAAQVRRLLGIIGEIDRQDPEGAIEIFHVQYTRAKLLMEPLNALLSITVERLIMGPNNKPETVRQQELQGVTLSHDERTNSIIAKGNQARLDKVREAIGLLDVPAVSTSRSIRSFELGLLDAGETKEQLAASFAQIDEKERPVILVQVGGNRLTVIGDERHLLEAAKVLEELEGGAIASGAPERRLVLLPLAHAVPAATVDRARALLDPRRAKSVTLVAGPDGESILVAGEVRDVQAVEEIVAILDRPEQIAERIITLERASAVAIAPRVRALIERVAKEGEAPLEVEVLDETNGLHLRGTGERLALAERFARELDVAPGDARAPLEVLPLRTADATALATALAQQYDARSPAEKQERPVRIAADGATNALLVAAHPEVLAEIEGVVETLNMARRESAEGREVRLFPLKNARAEDLARTLEAMYAEDEDAPPWWWRGQEPERDLVVRAETATNALIVDAPRERMADFERLIREIDSAASGTGRAMRTVRVDPGRVSAEDLAATLRGLLERGGGRVEVTTLEELLREQEAGEQAEPEADSEPAPEKKKTGEPTSWRGGALEEAIVSAAIGATSGSNDSAESGKVRRTNDFLSFVVGDAAPREVASDGASNGGADGTVTIAVDPATNSLVLIGDPREIDRLAGLAEQIARELPPDPGRVHYIALPDELSAESVAWLVNQAMRQIGAAGVERGALRQRASVIADAGGNALLVTSTEADFATIRALISAVARPPAAEPVLLRVYPLATVPADRAAARVRELLSPEGRARNRQLVVRIAQDEAGERDVEAVLDPQRVRVSADAGTNAIAIMAPEGAFAFFDELLAIIDRRPLDAASTLKLYPLRHARASELGDTLRSVFQARFQSLPQAATVRPIQPEFAPDERTNTLLVTASPEYLREVDELLADLDRDLGQGLHPLRTIELSATQPSRAAQVLEQVVVGHDQARRAGTVIIPDDASGVLLVRASADVNAEIDSVLAEIDRDAAAAYDVRTITLERADAAAVASAIQRFFDDRARIASIGRGRHEQARRVSVIGDSSSRTLLVAASDEDFAEIESLVEHFDTPQATDALTFRVFTLQHAKAADVEETLQSLIDDLVWNQEPFFWWGGDSNQSNTKKRGTLAVQADARLNALIVTGEGDKFDVVEQLIDVLDAPPAGADARVVRLYRLEHARGAIVRDVLTDLFTDPRRQRFFWMTPDPTAVRVRLDEGSNTLIVSASGRTHEEIARIVESIDGEVSPDETIIRTYALEAARASDAVRLLKETLQLDEKGATSGRAVRLDESAEAVEVTARVVADTRSNSLIVTATAQSFPIIEALIRRLDDVPAVSPAEYRIITLVHAPADDVAYTLDKIGNWEDGARRPRFDYNRVENQLIVSASADQFGEIERLLAQIDVPPQRERTTDFVPLEFAEAEKIREALAVFYGPWALEADTPGKRNVRLVADPATNSLVITAGEAEWADIRALLAKLDSEEYDSSLQLRVIALVYADAASVARAINEAFQGRLDRDRQGREARNRPARGGDDEPERRAVEAPAVLVEAEEWVRAAAEVETNSVIVSASRQNIRKIEQIIAQLDVAEHAQLPPPRLIPVERGSATALAASLEKLYAPSGSAGDRSRREMRIVADEMSSTIIVRADDDAFAQLSALASALQDEAVSGMAIFIIELEHVSPDAAKEVIETIRLDREADDQSARLVSEPLRISTMRGRNALIVVANPADRETIVALFKAIDAPPPFAEARTRIVRLRHAEAEALATILAQVLDPASQQSQTPLAKAVEEQVRRLAVRRDGLDEPDLSLDLTKPVRVIADRASNTLVISSTAENVEAVVELAAMFDCLPVTGAVTVQILPLENIAASEFARIVRELFEQGKNLARVPGTNIAGIPGGVAGEALLDEVAISIDERTNTVVVAGKEEAVALVEVLEKRLDAELPVGWVEPRIVVLQHADAADLAELLRAVLVDGASDRPEAAPLQRQIGRLRMARMHDGRGGRVSAPVPGADDPLVVEADVFQPMTRLVVREVPQLNAIVLVGTPHNIDLVEALVAQLDIEAASPDATVRIYPVKHASAKGLEITITRLFDQQVESKAIRAEDRLIVQADDRTNALIVTTSPRSFAVLDGLLETLDREVAPELRELRRIELENASASRLAPLLQELMDARLERLRRVQPDTAELERVAVVPDPRTNSLVVAAADEPFDVISRMADELDRTTVSDRSLVQVIPVELGNADRIVETIRAIMERRYADLPAELGEARKPLVMTDPRSNSLLVAADPEDLAAIADLVVKLEAVPSDPAVGLHVVVLPETANAGQLANRLQRLMRERQESLGAAGRPSDRVTIEADPVGHALVVAASDENVEVVRGLVDVLIDAEAGAREGKRLEIVSLRASQADDVVRLLLELYVNDQNRKRGPDAVKVSSDARSNSVVINAPPADVDAIRTLIADLDGTAPSSIVEIRYIPLRSANAIETVGLIQDVLSGRGLDGRRRAEQATVLRYLRQIAEKKDGEDAEPGEEQAPDEAAPEAAMELSAAIRGAITLTPEIRTNTVIVRAPSDSMAVIEQMIRDLDASNTGAKSIRIFKLTNADALAMAEILTDLFNLRQGQNLYVLKPREEASIGGGAGDAMGAGVEGSTLAGISLGGTELTAVPDERQQLQITVDSRTNSLLVSGTPVYLDLVEEVVEQLDALEANEREIFVYRLRNARAEDVARVLGEFVREEQEKLLDTLSDEQLGSAARLLEREVTISGDALSNSVLVSASPRYLDHVKRMLVELDVDPPQVLIQVMLAEISLDSDDQWGTDLSFEFGLGDALIAGGYGFTPAVLPGVPGLEVPNLSIATSDFQLVVNALQTQGRIQFLSNPSIMAANNQPARIQVGEEIRVPESTSFTDAGQSNTNTVERQTGIILQVTPSINPDGFVRLDVRPEISQLTDQTTQITENLATPVIRLRTASTTVTVHDGQTIVLGGLISNRSEFRVRKVPFLGDIPVLEWLFKSERTATAKTELLIVLTPHVIESPTYFGRVEELTDTAIDRLTLPDAVKERLREGHFDLGTELFDEKGDPKRGKAQDDGEDDGKEPKP